MSFDYTSYELGKRSVERLVEALRMVMCGDTRKACDELAELAGFIAGARDCDSLDSMLDMYFAWESLKWAYSPRGRPPSVKKRLVREVLCNSGIPVDEEFLREIGRRESMLAEVAGSE